MGGYCSIACSQLSDDLTRVVHDHSLVAHLDYHQLPKQYALYIITIFRQRIVGRATLVEKIAAQVIFVPMKKIS